VFIEFAGICDVGPHYQSRQPTKAEMQF